MKIKLIVASQLVWMAWAGLRPGCAIRVRVVDLAGVPEKVRVQAEQRVTNVLRRTGLEVTWLQARDSGMADLRLQFLDRRPLHLRPDSTGYAVLVRPPDEMESYGVVSYSMVQSAAVELDVDVAEMLGAAMAHEIGHLLLASSGHSRHGVMSPRFERAQVLQAARGELLFTETEAGRIRARWSGCTH